MVSSSLKVHMETPGVGDTNVFSQVVLANDLYGATAIYGNKRLMALDLNTVELRWLEH